MISIIIAFPKKETGLKIKNILVRNGFEITAVCVTGSQVMRVAAGREGIVISGIQYADMVYHELMAALPDTFEMVVIANQTKWEEFGEEDVIYLPLPLKVYDLVTTVQDLHADLSRRMKKKKNRKIRSKKEEGLISQAKEQLMQKNGWTEEEAHRYLQKMSMDSGNNLVDTAYMMLNLLQYKIKTKEEP